MFVEISSAGDCAEKVARLTARRFLLEATICVTGSGWNERFAELQSIYRDLERCKVELALAPYRRLRHTAAA